MINEKDLYFIKMAEEVAKHSTCNLVNVGCVIVKEGTVISTGVNAAVKGYKPCEEVGHVLSEDGRCMRQIHAETNAIMNGTKEELVGATAYVTLEPCDNCTKLLNQSGIKKVIFKKRFPNPYNNFFVEPMEWICLDVLDK
ncbi:deoxycytidylate deaminase [Calidifontibacillus oryziterrae]|uniref:deoxycytidylate deaminase n=1 Tax=Calidifontibacillus oryziterrae TaxID=1191699 RepID=UPI0002F335BF|nr:deaminase [Calidifontibacillus oryziterrae]